MAIHGPYASARVAAEGSSVFLGGWAMSATHWALDPVGRACVRARISANQITAASLVLGAGAGVAIGMGHWGIGGAIAAVSALGDTLDGIIARATGTASDQGELFDAAVDRYTELFFLGGVIFVLRASVPLLLLALGALQASVMVSYSTAKAEALRVSPPRGAMRRSERATYLIVGAMLVPIVGAVLPGWGLAPMWAALGLVALVGNVSAVRRLLAIMALARSSTEARR